MAGVTASPEEVADRRRTSRGCLSQLFVSKKLKTMTGKYVSERTVGGWEAPNELHHPRPEALLAVALLYGRSSNWLLGEAGADPVHPLLREACHILRSLATGCDAQDARGRMLWCISTAAERGYGHVLTPLLVGKTILAVSETVPDLSEQLRASDPRKWTPQVCGWIPLPERWLLTGDHSAFEEWHGDLASRIYEGLLLNKIEPERFLAGLNVNAQEIQGWAR